MDKKTTYFAIFGGLALVALIIETQSGGNVIDVGTVPSSGDPKIDALAIAIATAEGFGVPGSIPTRANNPGDLALGNVGNGTVQSVGQGATAITIFATVNDGWNALFNQLRAIQSGSSPHYDNADTLASFAATYAGGSSTWLNNVLSVLAEQGYMLSATNTLDDYWSA